MTRLKLSKIYFLPSYDVKLFSLLSSEHVISDNWALKHKIYTGSESHNLKKTTEKAVLMLKLQHVDEKIQKKILIIVVQLQNLVKLIN